MSVISQNVHVKIVSHFFCIFSEHTAPKHPAFNHQDLGKKLENIIEGISREPIPHTQFSENVELINLF